MAAPGGFRRHLALLFAIGDYKAGIPLLQTPVRDANALARLLESQHGFEVEVFADGRATSASILERLQDLAYELNGEDRVFVYFAGHGIAVDGDTGPEGFLLAADARRSEPHTFLPMTALNAALQRLPCRHLLMVLDCCFAGAFRWSSTRNLEITDQQIHRERFEWFIRDRAWQAIASAAHDQKALDVASGAPLGERGDTGAHSPFAEALMRGLSGAADLVALSGRADGIITATELFLYLEDALSPSPGGGRTRQTPVLWPLQKHENGQFVFLTPGRQPDLPPAPVLDPEANPWRGLKPYESNHANLFFGRRQASETLLERVRRERLVVVTGPSGIGKSSLVRAGVLPHLEDDADVLILRPGATPLAELAAILARATSPEARSPDEHALRAEPLALANWWRTTRPDRPTLLLVDQFEEVVTQNREAGDTAALLGLVRAILDDDRLSFRVILTIRSEFEPQFVQSSLGDRWSSARYLVPQMTQDELRRVIEGPAAVKVIRFESEALVDTLVNEVVQMPGALPLLSFALSEMYASHLARRRSDRALTFEDYASLQGGVTGALRVRANRVVDSIDDAHKATARRVLERLVSVESGEFARRRAPRHEFETLEPQEDARVGAVIGLLDEARLIVTDEADGERRIELAHDALILGWDRLVAWVRQDAALISALRKLTDDAQAWAASGRTPSFLWDDPARFDLVQQLLAKASPGLSRIEAEFARASAQRFRRNKVIRASILGASLMATIIVSVLGFFFYQAWRESQIRQSRFLADLALQQSQQGNHVTAMLLALEGLPDAGAIDLSQRVRPFVAEAYHALELASRSRRERNVLTGHRDWITNIAFSADGSRLLTASVDGTAGVWDTKDGKRLATFGSHDGSVAAISEDGTRVVTALQDHTLNVWDARRGRLIAALAPVGPNDDRMPLAVSFSRDGAQVLAAIAYDAAPGVAQTWDAATGRPLVTYAGHRGRVLDARFSPDGSRVLTVGDDQEARVWNAVTGRVVATCRGHAKTIWAGVFSPDARRILTGGDDTTLRLWDASTCSPLATFRGHTERVESITFSPDGRTALSASWDRTARLWAVDGARPLETLSGHTRAVGSAIFNADGSRILTGSRDGLVRLWRTGAGGKPSRVLATFTALELPKPQTMDPENGHYRDSDSVSCVAAFNPASGLIASSCQENVARFWTGDVADPAIALPGPGGDGRAVWSNDGSLVVTVSSDGLERFWAVAPGVAPTKPVAVFQPPENSDPEGGRTEAETALLDADGRKMLSTNRDDTTWLWNLRRDLASGTYIRSPLLRIGAERDYGTETAIFDGPGERILTLVTDRSMRLWSVRTRRLLRAFTADPLCLTNDASFSPDDRLVVAASGFTEAACIWDVTTGRLVARLGKSSLAVNTAVFSPDGRSVLTASDDFSARIWDFKTGTLRAALAGHTDRVLDARFSPDGRYVVTASSDGTARVWNARTADMLATLAGHDAAVLSAAFSPDGARILTASSDGVARIWRSPKSASALIAEAKATLPRCLTSRERARFFLSPRQPQWCSKRPVLTERPVPTRR